MYIIWQATTLGKGAAVPVLYVLSTGSGAIFAAHNGANAPLSMTVNCGGSNNVHTNAPGGGLQATVQLPPAGKTPSIKPAPTFMMALTALNPMDGYAWKYNVSAKGVQMKVRVLAARAVLASLAPRTSRKRATLHTCQ